jgi:hypothetical protein
MKGLRRLGILVAVVSMSWQTAAAAESVADPETGAVEQGAYRNGYFELSYPLPEGWAPALAGPGPSATGYYVLGRLATETTTKATLLIAAQDQFFAIKPFANALAMAADFRQGIAAVSGMTIDDEPAEITLAGHRFARMAYSGVGLHRVFLVTALRCHFVSFVITTPDPALATKTAQSLDAMSLPTDDKFPRCVKDYATASTVLHRVEPAVALPPRSHVAVRVIVGRDGGLRHVHVIRARPEQAHAIEAALAEWRFAPSAEGEIETGIVFGPKSTGSP